MSEVYEANLKTINKIMGYYNKVINLWKKRKEREKKHKAGLITSVVDIIHNIIIGEKI